MVVGCVCVEEGGGEGGIINTRNSIAYDIRLSMYNDGMGPVEVERGMVVEEKQVYHIY